MYNVIINCTILLLLVFSLALANRRRPEWLIIALGIGAVTTGTSFLFTGSSTYTFLQIGGTQVHATDIVIILSFLYLLCICLHPIRKSKLLAATLLLIVPFLISFTRGIVNHTYVSTSFLADIRKYGAFIIVLLSFFICFRDDHTLKTQYYIGVYVERYMVLMFGMTLLIWMLDIGLGLKSLPGQIGGTLSDGGSTFRIVTPSIVIVMAYYVLYKIYTDIHEYGYMKMTSMLMAAVIVLLQWRTVVAAFGVGIILVFIDAIIVKHKISNKMMAQFALIITFSAAFLTISSKDSGIIHMLNNLFESFSSIKEGTGTFSTRTNIWEMLLGSLDGINRYIGQPFGSAYAESITWHASAHSGYVDYIMKMGYLGVVELVLFMICILASAIIKKQNIIAIIVVSTFVYWVGYGLGPELAAVIGTCAGILDRRNQGMSNQMSVEFT